MMKIKEKYFRSALLLAFLVNMILASADLLAAEPIKIGLIQGLGGPLDVYARQEITGFKMGLEYATQGTNKIIGRDVKLIIEETQSKPDVDWAVPVLVRELSPEETAPPIMVKP